jgi:SOS-response transcriptional repressor LexA
MDNGSPKLAALKRALIEATSAGQKWTRRSLSLATGKGPDVVRDILSGKSKKPEFETISALAGLLEKPVSDFMDVTLAPDTVQVPVVGKVEAGVWREAEVWPEDTREYLVATPFAPAPNAKRFALRVEGFSMDLVFRPGDLLDCLDTYSSGVNPEPGDYVIVERISGQLRETTVKELRANEDGDYVLQAHSTRPEFAAPIYLGKPNGNHYEDTEIRVIGIVIGTYRSMPGRRFGS